MAVRRNIQYINKDFTELRASLINYARTYFPTTYNDFSPSSPGMMFMEMAAYVGDIMSFYLDNQIQETYLQYARQTNNLYELAYMFGYKPNVTQVAAVDIDFYQQIPSTGSPGSKSPDFSYSLFIPENTTVVSSASGSVSFIIEDPVDFSVSSSGDPTEVTVYAVDNSGDPTLFLLKKVRKAISSTINTTSFTFGTPEQFSTVEISSPNIVGILDIIDSDGNKWYEVDYLAQDTVFDSIKNTNVNDPNLSQYQGDTPYLLQLKGVQRRFTTRFLNNTILQLQFGAGTSADTDEEILPNPDNVGLGLPFEKDKLTTAFSPSNFVFTKTYGIAPSNTTLTVRYLTGGGVSANVPANTITSITSGNIQFLNNNLNATTANTIFNSLAVNNSAAADGGGDGDTTEELRQNASANFATQLRNVTQDDYLVRALSLPARYGVISKAYIEPTKAQSVASGAAASILDLYVLSFDNESKLRTASPALKQNLSTYLSQYRMVNDSISIKDAFIINIGVNFDIIVLPNFNSNEVLTRCILALQDFFAIRNWQINEPIILRDLYVVLDNIEGVQTVKTITISNKVGTNLGYSQFAYDIPGATINNVVYPSLDPMIFEVKYPNTDIQGRVVNL
jgi:phage-related baseplate assembly protein